MLSVNLYMIDTPLWYTSPIGPSVELKLSYNSKSTSYAASPRNDIGNKWQLNYGSYLYKVYSNAGVPAGMAVIMPDGKWDLYGLPDSSGVCSPPYQVFDTLTKTGENSFELELLDGTTYSYDIPSGVTTNEVSLLVEIRDAYGQKLTLDYDASARLTTLTDALGRVTTLSYNPAGLLDRATDPFGRSAAFEYDAEENLTKITDMGGYWTSFTYDEQYYLTGMTNAAGTWGFYFEPNDGLDNGDAPYPAPGTTMGNSYRLTVTDPAGGKWEYYAKGPTVWKISPSNYRPYIDATDNNLAAPKTSYEHSNTVARNYEVSEIITPEGTKTEFGYDSATGNLTHVFVPGGYLSYAYNDKGRVTSITDSALTSPSQAVTTISYAANGIDPVGVTDGLGTVVLDYNDAHDLVSITDRLSNTVTYSYNEYGQITSTTDQLGITTDYIYDASTHLLTRLERNGLTVATYTHDAFGRRKTATDATGLTLTYAYNDLDDIVKITYPDSKYKSRTYSSSIPHLVTAFTDRAGLTTQYAFTAAKQLTQIVTPDGGITDFAIDPNGNTAQWTDPLGNVTSYSYDDNNRLIKKTFADGKADTFTYDIDGRLASWTNARNYTFSYMYIGKDLHWEYSLPFSAVIYEYDQYHRPTAIDDASGDYAYSYDANSRLTSVDGPLANDTITYQYDAAGRKTGYAVAGGQAVSYVYDALDRVIEVTSGAGTFSFSYTGASPLMQKLTRPNGSFTEYQYDNLSRLTGLTNKTSAGTIINEYLYSYNDQDQRASETITNGAPVASFQNSATTFSYNNLNQLTSLTSPDRTFEYDADGNMTKGYVPGGAAFSAAYDAENQLISLQYTGTDLCSYFGYTLPCEYKREYTYRADGFLAEIQKDEGLDNQVTSFVGHGILPLQERDKSNNVVREYTWLPGSERDGGIGGLLGLRQGGQDYFYLYDGKGNVTAVINSSENVAATYAYDPFGNLTAKSGTLDQPYQFSTKPYDEKTGLSYYGYRFYSPSLQRWLTRDPIAEAGGFNLYAFVQNDPVNRRDPLGLEWDDWSKPNPFDKLDKKSDRGAKEYGKANEIGKNNCPEVEKQRNLLERITDWINKALGGDENPQDNTNNGQDRGRRKIQNFQEKNVS